MVRFVFLTLFALALPASAKAQTLWGDTKAGMSPAQVAVAHPDAVAPSPPAPERADVRVLLTIPEIRFEQEAYRVAFFFRDEKLEKVVLNYIDNGTFEDMLPLYNSVLVRMRERYGEEFSARSDRSETIKNEEHTWLAGETTVQINMTSFTEGDALFAIRYQVRANP